MLIPRFSIKILLIITAVAAVVSYILSQALKGGLEGVFASGRIMGPQFMAPGMPPPSNATGEPWAIALVMGMFSVAVVFSLFVLFWALAWLWEHTLGQALKGSTPQGGNPFASAGPPRQIVPPSEPQ
jgi:hypothetical protein